ncbi:MAG TPA: tRNA (adenosine(37)-N6)-threonylcarbamoyltransferase complex ATPase subunit type 1 TsaE [Opitutaceae bacterium]|nr:tRNA (adenosine(37)-N6)-threonylcarbamoyltransferase complex ATPase subunit type 1 TsaE [Opitutaceae bacterium]
MNIFAELRAGVITRSAEETRRLGARLAAALAPDGTLALHGDLGVGKTTFVQGLARGFGINDPVTSPTFNILHLYRGTAAPGRARRKAGCRGARTLVHLDAYRLENAHQVSELMLEDFLVSPYCLAIEWPERIAAWLPADALHLTLAIEAPGQHRIALN